MMARDMPAASPMPLGADLARHVARRLLQAGHGTPADTAGDRAFDMALDIAGLWPDDDAHGDSTEPTDVRPEAQILGLLDTLRLCRLITKPKDLDALTEQGSHTELIVPPGDCPRRIAETLTAMRPHVDAIAPPDAPRLAAVSILHGLPLSSDSADVRARQGADIAARVRRAIGAGHAALVVLPQGVDLGPDAVATRRARHVLPPVTRAVLADLLALVFGADAPDVPSVSADDLTAPPPADDSPASPPADDIRALLPPDDALARLDPGLFVAACRADSIAAAAARIRRYAARLRPAVRTTLADVTLAPAVRAPLLRLVRDLDRWRAGTVDWSDTVHAILLSGPPGNGKTMIAAALAGTLDVPLIATSYAQCQAAGHLGQYLAAMRAAVDRAIAQAPAVFFLDEVDSFLRRDTDHHNAAYGRQVVNDMLEQLTRLHATPGVVVLAATNAPEQVDPALRRAGRFDLALEIGPPDRAGLQAILQTGLGAASPGPDVLADIARALVGQSGAVAAAVAREALATARDAGVPVGPAHLATAVARHAPPLPRDLAWRVAVHEAGHVLVAAARGLALPERVTVGAQGGAALMAPPPVMTADSTLDWVAMLMGGRAAERAVFGAASSGAGAGPGSDLDRATALLLEMELSWGLGDCGLVHAPVPPDRRAWLPEGPRRKIDAMLHEAEAEALAHLRADMTRLIALARRLDETRHLDRTDIAALLEDHAPAPHPPEMDGATVIPLR